MTSDGAEHRLSRRKKLVFYAVMFVTIFALPEVVCRILGLGRKQEVAEYIANWKRQWASDFYVFKPSPARPGFNADGLRDRRHAIPKPTGTVRIACLGDSVTFGHAVPASQSYPSLLEARLRGRRRPVEVFNVALPGWSTRQQLIAYERIVRKYRPDCVIVGVCLNDVPETLNNLAGPPSAVVTFLYKHSNLVRWVMRPHAREIHRVEELFEHADQPRIQEGWRLFFNELKALYRKVRADNVRFAVLLFPFRLQVLPDPPSSHPQQLVAAFCRENGISFLNGLDALRPLGADGFIDYDHLSPKGATAIARLAADSEWLTGAMAGD